MPKPKNEHANTTHQPTKLTIEFDGEGTPFLVVELADGLCYYAELAALMA